MTHFASLNEDVLNSIISRLRFRDALSLSETCRNLHPISVGNAISDVYLTHPGQLERFCIYMLADAQNRLLRLRRLEIVAQALGVPSGEETWESPMIPIEKLADALEGASNLEKLDIECVQPLLEAMPRLPSILLRLRGMKELALRHVPFAAAKDLLPTRSTHLRMLILTEASFTSASPTILKHLASFPQLTRLECSTLYVSDFEHPVTLPSITHLVIGQWGHDIPLASIANTFPGVRRLHVKSIIWDLSMIDDVRWHAGESIATGCWNHLDELCGTAEALGGYITCPVRMFRRLASRAEFLYELEEGTAAIRRTAPVCISLYTFTDSPWHVWKRLGENTPRLRFLDIHVSDAGIGTSMDTWMENVPPALQSLRIVCMRLQITDICHAMPAGLSSSDMLDLEQDVINTLPNLLARYIASLQYLGIGIGDKRYDMYTRSWSFVGKTSWWRVSRDGQEDNVRMEPISADIGERVIAYIDSAEFEATMQFDGTYS
ncbi:hypothetical protein EVJ58_g2739 [Rhodofomes roseus]|uniref:F-box domain-containing protein n=1 Tax=Rhodofomes roseus TaxID=34475 RepID=A0A4Y9YT25_9APHY|nr:hypothetical protein EVJ58_g2739 [Rhodofomes roseus]